MDPSVTKETLSRAYFALRASTLTVCSLQVIRLRRCTNQTGNVLIANPVSSVERLLMRISSTSVAGAIDHTIPSAFNLKLQTSLNNGSVSTASSVKHVIPIGITMMKM